MVKYGIVSDTHISRDTDSKFIDSIFDQLEQIFRDVDAIIHAGDISTPEFLDRLQKFAPIKAVAGESDSIENISKYLELYAGKYKIGIVHELPSDLKDFFGRTKTHILIHGHTHQPLIEGTPFNTLLINPGSPTFPKAPPKKPGFNEPIARPSVVTMKVDKNDILSTFIINLKV